MAHIACKDHKNRVVYTPTSVTHRNGDGAPCDSQFFTAGFVLDIERAELLSYGSYAAERSATIQEVKLTDEEQEVLMDFLRSFLLEDPQPEV